MAMMIHELLMIWEKRIIYIYNTIERKKLNLKIRAVCIVLLREGCERMWKDVKGCERMWKDVKGVERMWKDVKDWKKWQLLFGIQIIISMQHNTLWGDWTFFIEANPYFLDASSLHPKASSSSSSSDHSVMTDAFALILERKQSLISS